MKIIANETAYAQRCLDCGYIDKKKAYKSIRAVVRYLKNKCDIKDLDVMVAIVQDYITNTGFDVSIDEVTIKTMMNEETPYYELESVHITYKELHTITRLKYPHSYKKILFAMLVQYKVKKELLGVTNNRIERETSEILSDAHVTLSKPKRIEMWRQFLDDGLITIEDGGKKAKYVYLNYIDKENDYEEDGLMVYDLDFSQFYLHFEQYVKGGWLINCASCGKLTLIKSSVGKGRTKYCRSCSEKVRKDVRKQINKKYRDKQK